MRSLVIFAALLAIGCSSRTSNDVVDIGSSPGTVACGTTTCDLATQVCCFTSTEATCVTGTTCPSQQGKLACDDPSDCVAGQACCGEELVGTFDTYCGKPSTCTHVPSPTICTESSTCGDAGLVCAALAQPTWLKACQ